MQKKEGFVSKLEIKRDNGRLKFEFDSNGAEIFLAVVSDSICTDILLSEDEIEKLNEMTNEHLK